MTLNFNDVSNLKLNNETNLNVKTKENTLDTTVEFKANELEQESTLSEATYLSSQLKLRRQRRQYDPNDTDIARLFTAIREHKNPKDKINKIKKLLGNVKNINSGDSNDNNNTPLHVAVQKGHQDIVDLLLKVQNININIKNRQDKTPFDLDNKLDPANLSRQSITLAQPGPSGVHTNPAARAHETYPASGLKHSLHGNIYQLKLLMLFLHRGLQEEYDFRLATEWDAAEKFDDLVFKYIDSQNHEKYRFLQAKHKQDEFKTISIGDLFAEQIGGGEFELKKYFLSYLKIKNNSDFKNGNLEDFIICTNIDFDLDQAAQGQIRKLNAVRSGKNKGKEISVEEITGNDVFFKQDDGKRYRLKDSNNYLAEHLKQGIQNEDTEINNFLEKLVFAVNQPNEVDLGKIISREIGQEFNLIDADLVTDNFQREMLDWMKKKGPKGEEGEFLSHDDGEMFFVEAKQKIAKLVMIGPTSQYSKKLKEYNVEFISDKLKEVKTFLDQNSQQILNLVVPQETRFSAIKVNQALSQHNLYKTKDSYIFTPLSQLMRLQDDVLKSFKAQETGNLLVIECKNGADNIQSLYSELKTTINNNSNKKIILITKQGDSLANEFKSDGTISRKYYEKSDDIGGLSDLTDSSQQKVLDKTVNFQGNNMPLGKVVGVDQREIIDGEVLLKLIDGEKIKIGNEVPIVKTDYIERKFIKNGDENVDTINDKIAVITTELGGGKSSTLAHLMRKMQRNNLSLWVVKINLIEHIQVLNTENFDNYDKEKAIDFLSKIIGLNSPLEKALFRNGFDNPNKIALFFDGFNEVQKDKVINLLNALKSTEIKRLLVTTDMNMSDSLKDRLQTPVYTLSPFSREEKTQLLQNFLKNNFELNGSDVDQERLKSYSEVLQNAFVESINDVHIREFTDTPLQMKMLAEAFQDEFKIFHDGSSSQPQINRFNIVNLYTKFIEKKFKDFSQVLLSKQAPKPQKQKTADLFYKASLKAHTILAVNLLFPEKDAELLLSKCGIDKQEIEFAISDLKEKNYNFGITEIDNGNIKFIHRTFAEYLAASFINNELNKPDLEKRQWLYEFLDAHSIESNTNVVRNFLDHFLAQDMPLHEAVLSGEESARQVLLGNTGIVNNQDLLGRTALHLAAAYGDLEVVKILLQNSAEVNIRDEIFNYSPITYADINAIYYSGVIELLLERGADFSDLLYTKNCFRGSDKREGNSLLKAFIEENRVELMKNLINYKVLDFLDYDNLCTVIQDAERTDENQEAGLLIDQYFDSKSDDVSQSVPGIGELVQISTKVDQDLHQTRKRHSDQSISERFPKIAKRSIEAQLSQQRVFIQIEKTIKSSFPNAEIKSVRQGLYIPSFEQRNVKIEGKCAAITRGFSQSLFLGKHNGFLSNLEVSAELYERLASGKQISDRERQEIFAFSNVMNSFEQKIDSDTSSLPSSLSRVKSVKTLSDLSNYVRGLQGNFAIHLVTSNHVVAICRKRDIYSYFDSNVALISNFKSVDQLIKAVDQGVKLVGYKIPEEGFLVEHFRVKKANQDFNSMEREILVKPIETERSLLSLQDQKHGSIEFNGQKLYRKTLYDMGAKLHSGGATILINSGMSKALLISSMQSSHLKITAREYLQTLKGKSAESIQEIVQATSAAFSGASFEGSISEIKNANIIRELVTSEDGQKLNAYELNRILKAPMKESLKTIPYYLEVAKARYSNSGRLVNAAGRISMIRGIHGVLHAASQGDMTEFSLGAGEIGFSMFSQLIEDKVVKLAPKIIKQMKGGIYITRGVGGLIGNAFDVVDLVRSSIDLSKAEKGSKEWRDAIAGVTFSSASIVSGVVFTAAGATGVGTVVGFAIVIGQGFYSGASMVAELKKYRLTTDEEFRTFWHTFALQPLPEDVQYITYRTDAVNNLAYQAWKTLRDNNDYVVAHAMGLGKTTLQDDDSTYEMSVNYQSCLEMQEVQTIKTRCSPDITDIFKHITPKSKIPILNPGYAVINMTAMHYTNTFSHFVPSMPRYNHYAHICLPECPTEDVKFGYDCTLGVERWPSGYIHSNKILVHKCENSMVIGHSRKAKNAAKKNINGKVHFDLKLVNSGKVQGSNKWQNEFIIHNGTVEVHGGDNTVNTFTLMRPEFKGQVFGGDNATNVIDVSNLNYNTLLYSGNDGIIDAKNTIYIETNKINYFIGSAERSETVSCPNDDMVVDGKGVKDDNWDYIYNCTQVTIHGNTRVNSNRGGDHKFYIIPSIGSSSIDIYEAKGLIIFPKTALLNECSNITYSKKDNILSLIIPSNDAGVKFTLDILNYLDEKNASRFTFIDKHGSVITPLIDLDRSGEKLQIDSFVLNVEIVLSEKEIEKATEKTIEEIWQEKLKVATVAKDRYDAKAREVDEAYITYQGAHNDAAEEWRKSWQRVGELKSSLQCSTEINSAYHIKEVENLKSTECTEMEQYLLQKERKVDAIWERKEYAIGEKWQKARDPWFETAKEHEKKLAAETLRNKELELNRKLNEQKEAYTEWVEKYEALYASSMTLIEKLSDAQKCLSLSQLSSEKINTSLEAYKQKINTSLEAYKQKINTKEAFGKANRAMLEAKEEEIRARLDACDDGIESACHNGEISIESITERSLKESEVENEKTELAWVTVKRVLEAEKKVEQAKQKVLTLNAVIRDTKELLQKLLKPKEAAEANYKEISEDLRQRNEHDKITEAWNIKRNVEEQEEKANLQLSDAETKIIDAREEKNSSRLKLQRALNRARKIIQEESDIHRVVTENKRALLKWYESIAKSRYGYKVYSVIKESNLETVSPYSIVGSTQSDIISLEKVRFAKGGEGADIYSLPAEYTEQDLGFIEIDNEANDKEIDVLYISAIPQEAKVVQCYLRLYRSSNSFIKIRDYFKSDKHRHLALIDDSMNMFIVLPGEGERSCRKVVEKTWQISDIKPVQLIPFYHATDIKNTYFVSEEQVTNHPVIAIDVHFNSTSFYRDYDDLLLIGDDNSKNKSLIVNLQGFYNNKNTNLYFYPDNHQLNLTEVAKLAVDYQEAKKSVYNSIFKEYSVNLTVKSESIDHALEKPKVGILILQNIAPQNIVVSRNGNDLIFKDGDNTLTLKNWDNLESRISVLKFDEEVEVIGIDKFNLRQISEIKSLINKADLSHAIDQKLQGLNNEVVNGLKYLLIARNAEDAVIGAHKCLGFDSVAEQQLFMASYQPDYNATTLKEVLCGDDLIDETVKALILLILKSYLADDQELSKQCFHSLVVGSDIDKIYGQAKFLEDWHSKDLDRSSVLVLGQNLTRHENLKQNIRSSLESTCAGFQERKRRAINLDDTMDVNEPEILAASSSGVKHQSWINEGVAWVKELVANVRNMINRSPAKNDLSYMFKKTLRYTNNLQGSLEFNTVQQYKPHKARIQSEEQHGNSEFSTNQSFSFNNFLSNENTAFAHCIADALDNNSAKRYQDLRNKAVEVVPSIQTAVNFALNKFEKFVEGKKESLNTEEQCRIHTELINAYPEIIASLQRGVEYSGNVGLDDVLEKCKECFCKNILSPKSEEVSAHLSDIEVTTFGNNLGR